MALKEKKRIDEKSKDVLKEIEKMSVTEKKKDNKKEDKKTNKKEEKKPTVKKESWFHGVKSEFKKVRWPNRKEMVKYSIATICFIIFFGLFFYAIQLIIWLIQRA
jgi:preprotein translocase subunit SecE